MKKTLFITLTVALALTLFAALGVASSANTDANVITEIKINMAAPEIGKTAPEPTVPEGANYKLSSVSWTMNGDLLTNEAVQDGKLYSFFVTVVPNEGYSFDENATVTVGGKKCDSPSVTPETIELSMNYDFRDELAEVSLTVGETKIGSPAPSIQPRQTPLIPLKPVGVRTRPTARFPSSKRNIITSTSGSGLINTPSPTARCSRSTERQFPSINGKLTSTETSVTIRTTTCAPPSTAYRSPLPRSKPGKNCPNPRFPRERIMKSNILLGTATALM